MNFTVYSCPREGISMPEDSFVALPGIASTFISSVSENTQPIKTNSCLQIVDNVEANYTESMTTQEYVDLFNE